MWRSIRISRKDLPNLEAPLPKCKIRRGRQGSKTKAQLISHMFIQDESQAMFLVELPQKQWSDLLIASYQDVHGVGHRPWGPENVRMVNMTFIGQSASDIRRKLQKLDDVEWASSQSVDVALKHSTGNNKESKKDGKQKPPFLAAVLDSQKPNNLKGGKLPPLGGAVCSLQGGWALENVAAPNQSISGGQEPLIW